MITGDRWQLMVAELREQPDMTGLLAALAEARDPENGDELAGYRRLVAVLAECGFCGLPAVLLAADAGPDAGAVAVRLRAILDEVERDLTSASSTTDADRNPSASPATGGAAQQTRRTAERVIHRALDVPHPVWPGPDMDVKSVAGLLVVLDDAALPITDVLAVSSGLPARGVHVAARLIEHGMPAEAAARAVGAMFGGGPAGSP